MKSEDFLHLNKNKHCYAAVAITVIMAFSPYYAYASEEISFNMDVLDVKDKNKIDLRKFSNAGYVMPGVYNLNIHVNKLEIPDQSVEYVAGDDNPDESRACFTAEMTDKFGLKDAYKDKLKWFKNNKCADLSSLAGSTIRVDLGKGILYVNIPQAYVEYSSENWDPPSVWDDGIPGIIFDYNLNGMSSHQNSAGRNSSLSGNGTTGVNVGPWRLRGDWQSQYNKSSNGGSTHSWDWSRYYAYRAIKSLGAKLTLGETYLESSMFDGFRFSGVALSTDDRQLPVNLRGYAPEVAGVAKTNAKVTVSQQGRVIYETTVSSGPFRIQDLSSAVSGKLDVKVEEEDGSIQNFTVDTANVPYLTRPGLVRYKLATGKPSDYEHHSQGPIFTTGEFSWGINNGWSLYGGAILSQDYTALAIGIGRDLLAFGALSLDVTESQAKLKDDQKENGGSYRLSYSKRFDDYDSEITFAGYRFAERGYMSMSQFLDARNQSSEYSGNDKEMYTITLNKHFRDINTSIYLNYSHSTYWNRPSSDTWNLSASQYFDIGDLKNVSATLSAYRTQYENTNDDGMYISMSVPWANSGTMSYNGQFSQGKSTNTAGYYDRIDSNNSYRINAGSTSDGNVTGSGYFSHDGDLASVTANASFTGSESNSVGMSLRSGITATAEGSAIHNLGSPGSTRMLVDTGGISDVPVDGRNGVIKSNTFGKAVISDVSSYYKNSVNIALNKLPDDIDATRSVVQGTLTEGAIGFKKFGIIAGRKAMMTIRLADGTFPPFGAEVYNRDGMQTGIISDNGNVWLAGMKPNEEMDVNWNGSTQCIVTVPPAAQSTMTGMLLPCRVSK